MHLVGLRLQPLEIALHAVPAARLPQLVRASCRRLQFALDDEFLHPRLEIAERLVDRDALARRNACSRSLLAFERHAALPRLDHAALDAEAAIGQRALVIDLDGAAKAAAGRAGALRIVEGEERGRRLAKLRCRRRDKPRRWRSGVRSSARRRSAHRRPAPGPGRDAAPTRSPRPGARDSSPRRRRGPAPRAETAARFPSPATASSVRRNLPSIQTRRNPCCFSVASAAASEGLFGIGTEKPTSTSWPARAARTCVGDLRRAERPHLPSAMGTGQRGQPREEQLQVIGDLGHRADGAARGLDRVALLDGDGGRQAVDAVDVGLVHALEKLARVGREGLDVAALALGVERVEGERRFARAAQARDHGQASDAGYRHRCS